MKSETKVRFNMRRMVTVLLTFLFPINFVFADTESQIWDSSAERLALQKMLVAGKNLCKPSQEISKIQISGGRIFADIQKFQFHPEALPLINLLQSQIQSPSDQAAEAKMLNEKRIKYQNLLAGTESIQPQAAVIKDVTIDAQKNLTLVKKVFLDRRIKVALLNQLPDSSPRKSEVALWSDERFQIWEDLLVLVDQEVKLIQSPLAPDMNKVLKLELQRLDLNAQLPHQLSNQKELEDRIHSLQDQSPQPPFDTITLRKAYNDYLSETTMVGAGFASCGLSLEEQVAIESYTEGAYIGLNSALWSGKPLSDGDQNQVDLIKSGFEKLNPYVGTVSRDAILSSDSLAQHQKDVIVVYKGLTSTSIRDSYDKERKVHLKISSKTGRYVVPFAQLWSESEVIFLPGSKFRVLSRQDVPDGSSFITMEEVE